MGILTDFFIATPAEVEAMDVEAGIGELPTVQSKGVYPEPLAELEAVLLGGDVQDCLQRLDESLVRQGDETCVFSLTRDLTAALARLEPGEVLAKARTLAAASQSGWQREGAELALRELSPLAARALAEGKGLYLWVSP